ncbi:MAG: DUF721 domain-containing protein [Nocardioidaceae bacterium]
MPDDEPVDADSADHDPSGLDLARSLARTYGNGPKRRVPKRRTGKRHGRAPSVSGAHPDDRDPQPLDATMGRLVAEYGWETDVAVHGVFGRWASIVGAEVAQHCVPIRFDDGQLEVQADATAWATQMRLLAPTVVRRMNEELGHGTVLRIKVLGPQGPTWSKGKLRAQDGRGPRDTYG